MITYITVCSAANEYVWEFGSMDIYQTGSILKGFSEGIVMGVLFAIINIGIMTILTQAIAQLFITVIAGAFIGAFLVGKYTSDHLNSNDNTNDLLDGKDTDSVKSINEKYEIVAEQVSNLRELGLSDEAIMSILSNVHNGKLPSVIDAVEGWKSSHSHGKLTDKQLSEICRGVIVRFYCDIWQKSKNANILIKATFCN